MAGLEKITNQIMEEANNSAKAKLEEAEKNAAIILKDAEREALKASEAADVKSAADVRNYEERVKSSLDLKRRTALLQTKQEIIADVIEKAYQAFCSREAAEYFETVKNMISKFALPQDGEIYFSEKDLSRLPSGFADEVAKIASLKGGSLKISGETRQMEGGFVLAYGGIEENCSFRALFDSKRDELQDQVQKILFS